MNRFSAMASLIAASAFANTSLAERPQASRDKSAPTERAAVLPASR